MRFESKWAIGGFIGLAAIVAGAVALNNRMGTTSITDRIASSIITDNGDTKINWNRYQTTDIVLKESVSITKSGVYHLTGSLNDGYININLSDVDGVAKIILDNVEINNPDGPAIACFNGEDLVIELIGKNNLSDSNSYAANFDEDVTGAIYSKADLSFIGDGTLNLTANYQDGIVSKDDLKFNSGAYNIVATDDAIRGKDSVYIVDGTFNLKAAADAIKTTNDTDNGKGFVLIEDGNFNIEANAKGIKATNNVLIYDGDFTLKTNDDAIHSNNYVSVTNGKITITSNDDGIHADKELVVGGGTINITKSYEGLEAQAITINNGDVTIMALDDGMNAGGGADASANNRPGAGAFDVDTNCVITISGGNISINASGDGIDSNGYVYFDGGTTIIDGPINNDNGALDSGAGININGGVVIAVGSSGMAETLGSNSNVYNASIYFASSQPAGTEILIKDSDDKTIIKHASVKSFSHMAVGTNEFLPGETYTIYIDDVAYKSFTISEVTTIIGSSNSNYNANPSNEFRPR